MKVKRTELVRGLDRNHPLLRPLQEGEDPAGKNPHLLQHLNVATYEQAAQKMAEFVFPGYRVAPKSNKHRRSRTSTVLLKAAGLPPSGMPDIVRTLIMKRILDILRDKKGSDKRLNFQARARKLLGEEIVGGWRNPYYLRTAVRTDIATRAKSLKEASRPGRFNEHHESLVRELEMQYSRWRGFEPLVLELLPIYLEVYITTNAGPELWDDFFQKCEQHCALLDKFKQLVERRYGPSEKPNPATMLPPVVNEGEPVDGSKEGHAKYRRHEDGARSVRSWNSIIRAFLPPSTTFYPATSS
jgi:hypothetical protein